MANKDIEQKIKSAFSKSVPDILDSVLQQCSEQKGTVIEMTENKKKKGLIYKIAAIAAAFVVLFGGTSTALKQRCSSMSTPALKYFSTVMREYLK